ncbi:SETMR methyltransferase, partial [Pseudoatta argentina]
MENNEFRAMIKHLHMKSLTLEEIKAESDNVQSTVKATDISYDTVILILHEQLGMKKLSVRWVCSLWIISTKKAKTVKSTGKVMVTVFWDARGIKKRPHLAKKKVFFHQDNARVHTCPALMVKFNEFRYELFPYPAYSLDLAPCDYFLFPNLKKWFGGKRFITREQLIAERESIELKGNYVEK